MQVDIARHIIRGALQMEVNSSRRVLEPAGNPTDADIENAVGILNAHVAQLMGEGRTLGDAGLTFGHLPQLLREAGVVSDARALELTRVDMTKFMPHDFAYGYNELGTTAP